MLLASLALRENRNIKCTIAQPNPVHRTITILMANNAELLQFPPQLIWHYLFAV